MTQNGGSRLDLHVFVPDSLATLRGLYRHTFPNRTHPAQYRHVHDMAAWRRVPKR